MRWGEWELRECITGESGGETTRGWVAPSSSSSSHLTGYPGGLKFPGRSDQYFSIFRLVGNWTNLWIFPLDWLWLQEAGYHFENWERDWRYPRPAASWWQGEEEGRWKPGRWSPGGWRCEGGRDIFLLRSQEGVEHIQFYNQHLIWLPRGFVQWSKHWQLIAEWKWKWTSGPGWQDDRLWDQMWASMISLSLFDICSFSFFCDFRQCLTKNRLVWKCSQFSKINCSDIKQAFDCQSLTAVEDN